MDVEDLEDGEITSGDEEDEDNELSVDYEVLQRPIKKTIAAPVSEGSCRTKPHTVENVSNTIGKETVKDEYEDDKSSSSSEDSDDDGPSGKKCRRMPDTNFRPMDISNSNNNFAFGQTSSSLTVPPTNATANSTDNADFKNQATQYQQKRKVNDIWSKVLQEEEVSTIFGKVNVEEYNDQHVLIDRGPETFSVKYNRRLPIRKRSDSSSVSSGGLTDNELEFLRGTSLDDGVREHCSKPEEGEEDYDRFHFGTQRRPPKRGFHDTKKQNQRKKRKGRMINKMKKMSPQELGTYIAEKLTEPKKNLIINSIQLLGKEPCIQLFLKTTKIERRGGLMIVNQQRRRTPGGVFFYLLRGDRKYPKRVVDKIFAMDRQIQTKGRKRAHKEKLKKGMEKLEEKKKEHEATIKGDKSEDEEAEVDVMEDKCEDEGGMSGDEADSEEVDSDEFCGTLERQESTYSSAQPERQMVGYDEDFLDLHCDPSDLM